MSETFATEDVRKDNLFRGWIEYLRSVHASHSVEDFEEVHQGYVVVRHRSKNRIDFKLDDGSIIRNIHITPAISDYTRKFDHMFVTLGRLGDVWLPLDVLSIGSIVSPETGEVHFSINPLYMPGSFVNAEPLH